MGNLKRFIYLQSLEMVPMETVIVVALIDWHSARK